MNHTFESEMSERQATGSNIPADVELAEVFSGHRQSLLATAQRITKNRSTAEDVVQDLFADICRKPQAYDPGRGALKGWLHMRCRGMAIDKVRSEAARGRRELEIAYGPEAAVDDVYPSSHATDVVAAALAELTETDRRLIELTFFRGLSYQAAAAFVGVPEGTTKSRIRRVLAALELELRPLLAVDHAHGAHSHG